MPQLRNVKRKLFLDFDGVLHPTTTPDCQLFCRLPLLQEALANYPCQIVISSSWRHHHEAAQIIARFPSALRERIEGFTGRPHIGRWPRYQEIQNYLTVYGGASWRALDDSFIEFPKPCPELILCNPNVGMDASQVTAVRRWLSRVE